MSVRSETTTYQQAIDRFWETFPPIWDMIRGNLRNIVTQHYDITVEQFHILRNIRKGNDSISELAKAKKISRPAISQAVDVLVGKGLITRHQNEVDRRFVQLQLTPSGSGLLEEIFQMNREWMLARFSTLSEAEVETVIQGMDVLKRVFDEAQS